METILMRMKKAATSPSLLPLMLWLTENRKNRKTVGCKIILFKPVLCTDNRVGLVVSV